MAGVTCPLDFANAHDEWLFYNGNITLVFWGAFGAVGPEAEENCSFYNFQTFSTFLAVKTFRFAKLSGTKELSQMQFELKPNKY